MGYHLDMWELLRNNQNAAVNNFDRTLTEFECEFLEAYNYEDQMECLKRPDKMEPSQFLLKLRAANRMAIEFPNVPEDKNGFLDLQLLAAMPKAWQDNFENASVYIYNSTLQELVTNLHGQTSPSRIRSSPRTSPMTGTTRSTVGMKGTNNVADSKAVATIVPSPNPVTCMTRVD